MALATIDIVRLTGSGPTETSITSANTRWSASDDPAAGTNNPVPIPTSGINYSYWVTTRLKSTANPDGHTINNLRWFAATNNAPPGLGYSGNQATAYDQATGTLGTTGDQLTTSNYTGLSATPVDVFTLTSASPMSITGSTTSTGQFGNRFVYQAEVDSTATAGLQAGDTFTWRYDEG